MKRMSLGKKIYLGFSLLIILMLLLGGMSVWEMKGVQYHSKMLIREYMPEVNLANQLRSTIQNLMFEMRGYTLAEDKTFYENTIKELTKLDEILKKAHRLLEKAPHLVKLRSEIGNIEKEIQRYKEYVEKTKNLLDKVTINRKAQEKAASMYMKSCYAYLENQNKKFKKELKNRKKKIALITRVARLGAKARVLNYQSQAFNDPALMKKAIEAISKAKASIDKLRKLTKKAKDVQRIKEIQKSMSAYAKAMKDYLDASRNGALTDGDNLSKLLQTMAKNADIFVSKCEAFLNSQQEELANDMNDRHTKITLINNVIDLGNLTRIANYKAQTFRNPKIIENALNQFPEIEKTLIKLHSIPHDLESYDEIETIQGAAIRYRKAMKSLLDNWLALESLAQKREDLAARLVQHANMIADAGMNGAERIADTAYTTLSRASLIMTIGSLIALLIGIALAVLITRSITKPMSRLAETLNDGAEQVASAAAQVSSASQSMAEGTSQQAAAVEESSSSLEEMSSMTRQNADNAIQANNHMKETHKVVEHASESMSKLSRSMEEISQASEEISKIIKTIDEIAFQTNLLALNAAVEAARAGEAGAGFAVVADEVRNLAMRAAEAAKNTANLIETTVVKVRNGSELMKVTQDAFDQVAQSAKKVAEIIDEIAKASEEQAEGIEQINRAVSEMDKVTQQNAANAEETASASQQLNAQSAKLKEIVAEIVSMIGQTSQSNKLQTKLLKRRKKTVTPTTSIASRKTSMVPSTRAQDSQETTGKEVKPEEIIPLEENQELKDF